MCVCVGDDDDDDRGVMSVRVGLSMGEGLVLAPESE